jgi:hypothetical protein
VCWRTAKRKKGRRRGRGAVRNASSAALLTLATCCALAAPSAAAQLPDGRAYELVSPSAKLGNDVVPATSRTRAAAFAPPGLPMAVAFASLGGFVDVRGTGISTEYLAQRTGAPGTSGWTTHAITPLQQPMSVLAAAAQLDPLYEGDMSPDLSTGVFRAWSPLTSAPNVAEVENLYLRSDLRVPGAGAYALLTGAFAPLPPIAGGAERPYLAGTSADFRHAIFESRLALTPDASGTNVKLYKAGEDGSVRLIAPSATCPGAIAPAAPCSAAGLGAAAVRQTTRTISADGSRVLVTAPVTVTGTVSTSGSDPSSLFQLDDHGTPSTADDELTKLNASEKAVPDAPEAARFQTASTDGERVFFTSGEQLTDAPGGGLYRWTRAPAGGSSELRHLTLIPGGGTATAAIGASTDGRRVYLLAPAPQLIPGGPAIAENGVYLWEDDGSPGGTLSFVGEIGFADAAAVAHTNATLWNQFPLLSRVTPDGGNLLLGVSDGSGLGAGHDHGICASNPNGAANGRCTQLYLYRAAGSTPLAPSLVCVSCPPSGAPATANALVNVHAGSGAAQLTWRLNRPLTDDGRRVFFSSAEALVAGDANGKSDAYVYDAPSGTVALLSSGRDAADAYFMDASASGDDAFLLTRERLVGWDVDASYDLYNARVGGGFPEPAAAGGGCEGEACRGTGRAPPPPALVASPAFVGDGNARGDARRSRRARRCRRGFAKKRVEGKRRCVKRGGRSQGRRARGSRG